MLDREITQEYLHELFTYNAEEGCLYWKHRPPSHFRSKTAHTKFNNECAYNKVGHRSDGNGHTITTIQDINHPTKDIIWIWHYGNIPDGYIVDLIDGDGLNSRIANLKLYDKYFKAAQRKTSIRNTTGVRGVRWNEKYGHWAASLGYKRKDIYLGCSKNKDEAIAMRLAAEIKYHGKIVQKEST